MDLGVGGVWSQGGGDNSTSKAAHIMGVGGLRKIYGAWLIQLGWIDPNNSTFTSTATCNQGKAFGQKGLKHKLYTEKLIR